MHETILKVLMAPYALQGDNLVFLPCQRTLPEINSPRKKRTGWSVAASCSFISTPTRRNAGAAYT